MNRTGVGARWWVGLCAGLMIAGCGGSQTSEPEPQTPSQGETPPNGRVGQPPAQDPSTPTPTPPADTISLAPSRWQASLGQSAVSVATDPNGNVYALALAPNLRANDSEDPPLVLTKTDASGQQVWSRSWSAPGNPVELDSHSLAISPEGNIFLAYTVNCVANQSCHMARYNTSDGGSATAWNAVLVKLSPSAQPLWVRSVNTRGEKALGVSVNSMGTALLLTKWGADGNSLHWFQWDGTYLRGWDQGGMTAVTFDPQDNIIVGSSGPVISKFTSDLTFLWRQHFEGPRDGAGGSIVNVGTTARGTIVASGYFKGDYNWGSSAMIGSGPNSEGTFLIVAEADGTPRWGLVPSSDYTQGELVQAVDASGQVVLASGLMNAGNKVTVDRYNLAGEHLWRHQLGNTQECGAGWPLTRVTSIAITPNHDAILGGVHTGPANLGSGCVQGSAGFVLDLKP